MVRKQWWVLNVCLGLMLVLGACAAHAPTPEADSWEVATEAPTEEPTEEPAEEPLAMIQPTPAPLTTAVPQTAGGSALPQEVVRSNRMIVKDAQVKLLVADTDVAMDRITQIAGDTGGYIISSRVWYQPWLDENYKYASITLGVPVDQFENAIRRLRAMSIRVLDETAAGQDVTDEYVDLQSRLRNLEATRDRIREFLDQAKSVEEALQVNAQLAAVEAEIEQVQGRMNYLFDRAAYSTLTIQVEPELPPMPVPPTPTPTPETPWDPGAIARDASETSIAIFQGLTGMVIWFGIVLFPFIAPVILIVVLIIRRASRKKS